MPLHNSITVFIASALLPLSACFADIVIDFDDQPVAGPVATTDGDVYSSLGISFASGDIPDAVNLGDVITLSNRTEQFSIISNTSPRSAPNFAGAEGLGLRDTLMTFSQRATSVSLDLDANFGEPADLVRLLGLQATGTPNSFRILAITEMLDNVSSRVTINSTSSAFDAAIFQVTTETEGFDNLVVTSVPEPSSAMGFATCAAIIAIGRRRRSTRR
jgi:hypothetical protein